MKSNPPEYFRVEGKTYSLFGNTDSTSSYFDKVRLVTDKILEEYSDAETVIDIIKRFSNRKRLLKSISKIDKKSSPISKILHLANTHLKEFTEKTPGHLKTLSVSKIWDRRLATSREQYHLYMVEIELTNRIYGPAFKKSDRKIALLPYCLQDFSVNCKSSKNGFDHQCRHCSGKCFQNFASEILSNASIEPYIWMEGDMKQLARYTFTENKTFGVLGIACIPELLWGMRNCIKNNIPVVGIPLNANRCIRWFGEFHPNSIDLSELQKLVT